MKRALLLPVLAFLLPVGAQEQSPSPTPAPAPAATAPVLTVRPTPAARRSPSSLAEDVRRAKASATPVPKKRSLGSITNENLKKTDGTGKGSVQMAPAQPIGTLPTEVKGLQSAGTYSEIDWRRRAAEARGRLSAAEENVKRLELEVKRLENDFYAWSDGNYRDRVIKPAWDQAREELKKAHAELDAAQGAQSDLEEEARKEGVPPGWLRESSNP